MDAAPPGENHHLKRRVDALQGLINDQFFSMIHFCLTLPFGGSALMEQMLRELAELHSKNSLLSPVFLASYAPPPKEISPPKALEYVIAIHIKEKIMKKDWFRIEENGNGRDDFTVYYDRDNCFYYKHCNALVCEGFQCVCVRRFFYEGIIRELTGEHYRSILKTPELKDPHCAFYFEKAPLPSDTKEAAREKIASTVEENLQLREAVEARTTELEKETARLASEIRQHKQTEDDLREAREKAEESNRLKSEFLANISHELRTPLTSIMGFPVIIDQILGKYPHTTPDEIKKALNCTQILSRQGEKLLSLINNLIDLSQLEADRLELKYAPLPAHSLLSSVVKFFEAAAGEKNLTLIHDCGGQKDFIFMGDAKCLMQILHHLTQNAIKFSHRGMVKLSACSKGERIIFQVSDEGIGMAEKELAWIFEGFRQLDSSSSRRYGGTGLGLDLVKRLVDKMGGQITVKSSPGQGAVFTVSLPWIRPEKEAPFAASPATGRREFQE